LGRYFFSTINQSTIKVFSFIQPLMLGSKRRTQPTALKCVKRPI